MLRIYPLAEAGEERVWRRSYEKVLPLIKSKKIECTDSFVINQVIEAGERSPALFSNWVDARYNAGIYGANLLSDIMGEQNPFSYPKSVHTVEDALFAAGVEDDDICLDYFAGSGTTGHAVINLNREDGDQRKFVLVEMANHFDSVLIPRLMKIIFSPEWKAGKPVRAATKEECERTPQLIKVIRLEGYEDSLHSLVVNENLEAARNPSTSTRVRLGDDDYRLRYFASIPLQTSASMLNLMKMEHPFSYSLEIITEDGPTTQSVDLIETFNFLYGLNVQRLELWKDPKSKCDYLVVKAKQKDGRSVLVVWRNMQNVDAKLEREFLESRLKSEGNFDEKLINGDTATPGFVSLDPIFKRLMEEEER